MAQQRLDSLYKRLKRDDTLRQIYAEVIETCLKNNYARVVPLVELKVSAAVWSLPHFQSITLENLKYVLCLIVLQNGELFL